jgi:hypothetical protein
VIISEYNNRFTCISVVFYYYFAIIMTFLHIVWIGTSCLGLSPVRDLLLHGPRSAKNAEDMSQALLESKERIPNRSADPTDAAPGQKTKDGPGTLRVSLPPVEGRRKTEINDLVD